MSSSRTLVIASMIFMIRPIVAESCVPAWSPAIQNLQSGISVTQFVAWNTRPGDITACFDIQLVAIDTMVFRSTTPTTGVLPSMH